MESYGHWEWKIKFPLTVQKQTWLESTILIIPVQDQRNTKPGRSRKNCNRQQGEPYRKSMVLNEAVLFFSVAFRQ